MPELRQDPTTKEWVSIAIERAKRPDQFADLEKAPRADDSAPSCPFCPGREHLTPEESFALRESGGKNQPGWKIRVIPNKFAAFSPLESFQKREQSRFFNSQAAFGYQEVLIESPAHDKRFPLMSAGELAEILQVYCQRYYELRKDRRVKLILVFRNYGARAGTSLAHPHSQIVALPIIPLHIRQMYQVAIRYYDDTGHCLYCDLVEAEKAAGKRIVLETQRYVVIHPYASQVPFESWILPKHHEPCFARIIAEERLDLARVLQRVLRGLYDALGDPDFNLIIHTAPVEDETKPYFLWHIEIRPRLTTPAGFELGTGVYINTAIPEQTAPFLHEVISGFPGSGTEAHASRRYE